MHRTQEILHISTQRIIIPLLTLSWIVMEALKEIGCLPILELEAMGEGIPPVKVLQLLLVAWHGPTE